MARNGTIDENGYFIPDDDDYTDTLDMTRLEDAQAMVEAALREAADVPKDLLWDQPIDATERVRNKALQTVHSKILSLDPDAVRAHDEAIREAEARGMERAAAYVADYPCLTPSGLLPKEERERQYAIQAELRERISQALVAPLSHGGAMPDSAIRARGET